MQPSAACVDCRAGGIEQLERHRFDDDVVFDDDDAGDDNDDDDDGDVTAPDVVASLSLRFASHATHLHMMMHLQY